LFFLAAAWVALGIWSSSLSQNQIVAFLWATFAGFILYYGFDFLSRLPGVAGRIETTLQKLGMAYHYDSISRGLVDSRDVLYFISVTLVFLLLARLQMENRKR
jgi:ABC-2 type transport system permease protein